jgi:uncharacterized membrane protein YgcG
VARRQAMWWAGACVCALVMVGVSYRVQQATRVVMHTTQLVYTAVVCVQGGGGSGSGRGRDYCGRGGGGGVGAFCKFKCKEMHTTEW